jgi:hypothetical protein
MLRGCRTARRPHLQRHKSDGEQGLKMIDASAARMICLET